MFTELKQKLNNQELKDFIQAENYGRAVGFDQISKTEMMIEYLESKIDSYDYHAMHSDSEEKIIFFRNRENENKKILKLVESYRDNNKLEIKNVSTQYRIDIYLLKSKIYLVDAKNPLGEKKADHGIYQNILDYIDEIVLKYKNIEDLIEEIKDNLPENFEWQKEENNGIKI